MMIVIIDRDKNVNVHDLNFIKLCFNKNSKRQTLKPINDKTNKNNDIDYFMSCVKVPYIIFI